MLSGDEEHELALLEESLGESGWRRFRRAVEAPVWRHRWQLRLLLTFGVLVTICGGVTGSGDLLDQGLLVTTIVLAYWGVMVSRRQPGRPPRRRPGHSSRGW
jgi:hypothetical protein